MTKKLIVATNAREVFKTVLFIETRNLYLRVLFEKTKKNLKNVSNIPQPFFEGSSKKTTGEYAGTQRSKRSFN